MEGDIFLYLKDYILLSFKEVIGILFSPFFVIIWKFFKIFSFFLSFYFLIGIIIYFKKLNIFLNFYKRTLNIFGLSFDYLATKRCQKNWREIENLLNEPYDSSWKLAVLKAFGTVKKVLDFLGYPSDFKEAIKKLRKEGYHNLEVIEGISQIVDKIITEKDFSLRREEAKKIVGIYKKFFQEILISIS